MSVATNNPVLAIDDLVVRYGATTVLAGVCLQIAPRSVMVLTGPVSAGKSTLVRAVTGELDDHPTAAVSGQISYGGDGHPYRLGQSPKAVAKPVYDYLAGAFECRGNQTRQQLEKRIVQRLRDQNLAGVVDELDIPVVKLDPGVRAQLRVVRAMISGCALICLDEPARGLNEGQSRRLMETVRAAAAHQAVLMVTHNQRRARRVGDQIALLCGGQIVEQRSVKEFFGAPRTVSARRFVNTGSCSSPSPSALCHPNRGIETQPEQTTGASSAPQSGAALSRPRPYRHPTEVRATRGFRWLVAGRLGTSPIPGAVEPIDRDLQRLERIGVTLLVTLTERPLPDASLRRVGLENIHFPIVDTEAPQPAQAAQLCATVARWLHNGACVVFHCRAGQGRAGTMLCSMLVWAGHTAGCALSWARTIYESWVQTDCQESFLTDFDQWLADNRPRRDHRQILGDVTPFCSCQ